MPHQAPLQNPAGERRTTAEIQEIAVMVRLHLYNRGLPCGAKKVRHYMATEYAIDPLPSERTINRILSQQGLTNGRTGIYEE
ncbi:MAG: hypothetical protein R6V33_01620 [Pelovirga sp.]